MADRPGFTGDQPSERLELLRRGLIGPWRETYLHNAEFQQMVDELAYTMARTADMMAIAGDTIRRDNTDRAEQARTSPVHVVLVGSGDEVTEGVRVVELDNSTLVRRPQ
jgi:hypothetical protein